MNGRNRPDAEHPSCEYRTSRNSKEYSMNIILYKAPNCLRCNIVKSYLEANVIPYEKFDLADDKDIVNKFYRDNRARLYRNPEGVEFPMFHETEGDVILQGTGVVLAWLLAGNALDSCVTRSDLLHGWISGLYVSQCPDGQEDKFLELIRLLSRGGLQVCLQSDGRKADLLEKILSEGLVSRVILNVPGPAGLYPQAVGGSVGPDFAAELKKSVELVKAHPDHVIRIWLTPLKEADGSLRWPTPAEAGEAAKMVADACGDMMLPIGIQACAEVPAGMEALDNLLPYRSKVRNALPKAEILKNEA